ncbi:MAG: hypothetical protein Q8L53_14195 [Aestuariivirga sp.]|nr:hypothetical protein [Aestuariivirga sp.]
MQLNFASCPAQDLVWETFAWGAENARLSGYVEEAKIQWRIAKDISEGFDKSDPRLASSLNSLGVCHHMMGNIEEARSLYFKSLSAWNLAAAWVARIPLQLRATSVNFHFGLQQRYRHQLTALGRNRYRTLVAAGEAATKNNLACLLISNDCISDAKPLICTAPELWRAAIGSRDEGLAIIYLNLGMFFEANDQSAEALQARKHADEIRRNPSPSRMLRFSQDCSLKMTDERRLKAAIYLGAGPYVGAAIE